MKLSALFDAIYVINLPSRTDRREEMLAEIEKIDERGSQVFQFFPAIRPADDGGFPTIGTRGCFESHLGVLKLAESKGHRRILILEDDVNFVEDFSSRLESSAKVLREAPWSIYYGGWLDIQTDVPSGSPDPEPIASQRGVVGAHMVGFQGPVIGDVVAFLEQILSRPPGHPDGGPMHVDGAYSMYRGLHGDKVTLISYQPLCYQRASRTDIHPVRWYDRVALFSIPMRWFRRLKTRRMAASSGN